jgi:hypothetical protein
VDQSHEFLLTVCSPQTWFFYFTSHKESVVKSKMKKKKKCGQKTTQQRNKTGANVKKDNHKID